MNDYIIHVGVTAPNAAVIEQLAATIEDDLKDSRYVEDFDVWYEDIDKKVGNT